MDRLDKLREITLETLEAAVRVGPQRAASRSINAAVAVLDLLRELSQEPNATSQANAPRILRRLFEKLGTTFIKLGQFIASSPTLFPEEYVLEFQQCLDRTTPFPFETVRAIIKDELGRPIDDVFSYIDPRPLAAASIAQVHAAVLKGSNKDVVIKVLKPGVEDTLQVDLNFLYISARVLEFLSPELSRTSLGGIVGDLRASILEETNFIKEAEHIAEFSAYLDTTGMRRFATTPFVYPQFSSRRVLVMERLYGAPLTDLEAISRVTSADPEAVLISALNTWFGSLIGCSTFHADVHAGNLLVLRDGRVGFIDFGIVGRISPGTWNSVQALLTSTVTSDYETMAKALVTMGATSERVDIPSFARDLEKLFTSIEQLDTRLVVTAAGPSNVRANVSVDEQQMSKLVIDVVRVGEIHGLKFPREFGLLLKQLLYFDRYIRILAPELQLLNDARITAVRGAAAASQSYL